MKNMKATKLKRNFWLTSEIECMLELIKDVQSIQGTTATTHYTFVNIANKMKRRGFPNKSPTQIRRKWFQMKSAYLCFKRGNTHRLLLIPERFRPIIAEFVDAEYKNVNLTAASNLEAQPVENTQKVLRSTTVKKIHHQTETKKNSYHNQRFTKFLERIKHTHKVVNRVFNDMQQSLMLFEQKCQAIRDNNIIMFIKTNDFKY